jgi:hypothetical protein
MLPIPTGLTYGAKNETVMWGMPATVRHATWTADMKIMNTNYPVTAGGFTITITGEISGYPIISGRTGVRILTDDGSGPRFTAMSGPHMIPGVTSPTITAGGSGTRFTDGIGIPVIIGPPHGSIGHGTITTTAGVR